MEKQPKDINETIDFFIKYIEEINQLKKENEKLLIENGILHTRIRYLNRRLNRF